MAFVFAAAVLMALAVPLFGGTSTALRMKLALSRGRISNSNDVRSLQFRGLRWSAIARRVAGSPSAAPFLLIA